MWLLFVFFLSSRFHCTHGTIQDQNHASPAISPDSKRRAQADMDTSGSSLSQASLLVRPGRPQRESINGGRPTLVKQIGCYHPLWLLPGTPFYILLWPEKKIAFKISPLQEKGSST